MNKLVEPMRSVHKIVSYNVLSSSLARADHFHSCDPEHLDAKSRLSKLLQKLDSQVADHSIVCLQEVSTSWSGQLHAYFSRNNYHLISGHYGHRFNGYMGVAVAVPNSKYEILDADITRIGDTLPYSGPPKPSLHPLHAAARDVLQLLGKIAKVGAQVLRLPVPDPPLNPWKEAAARMNQLVAVRVKARDSAETFVVGNYHMPCMFRCPPVMMIHCVASAQHVAKFAGSDPYVYAGDFNIKPGSSMYRMLTEGQVEEQNPELPDPPSSDIPLSQLFQLTPLRSAYKEALSTEPQFTNFALTGKEPVFKDTLDYVFVSQHWRVEAVEHLPTDEEATKPMPTETEPSDHLLIAASLALA